MDTQEYVFYIAGAYVIEVYQVGRYKLWLPDLSNKDTEKRWRSGERASDQECVVANRNYAIDLDDAETAEEFAGGHFVLATVPSPDVDSGSNNLTTLPVDMIRFLKVPARIAISEELWNQIPIENRPLPPLRDQDYRLRVVVRITKSGEGDEAQITRTSYIGFHVEIKAINDDGRAWVHFYSWTNGDLGDVAVDLTDPMFDPVANGHSTISAASRQGDQGALFITVDGMKAIPFLVVPKVPFGAQESGRKATQQRKIEQVTRIRAR